MVKIPSETRNILLIAGVVLLVFVGSVVWGEETAIILGAVFGGLAGFVKGFTWLIKRREVKLVE